MFRKRSHHVRHLPSFLQRMKVDWLPSRIPLRPQRENIPLVITLICSSVSIPPALCANAGIEVPRTPLATTLCTAFSSTMARYTGLARPIDAPPRPSAPWQPAQFCAYKVPNSRT